MKLVELKELFDVKYGTKLDANKMEFVENGEINFISRDSKNNGCVGTVKKYKSVEPFKKELITVSLGGSFLLSSFVQPKIFYTAQNVCVLEPKKEMDINEKLFYCKCISMNRFKYSAFGREANKSLKYLKVPKNIPKWITTLNIARKREFKKPMREKKISLQDRTLKCFRLSDLFKIRKGKRIVVSKETARGNCPFISATDKNNGISEKLDLTPNQDGNTITVSYDGSVGEAFYQAKPFWAADSVNVLYPKVNLNSFIAMFLITMIRKEKYRFSYGRKWHKERMEESTIKLPVDKNANPDWQFMEAYIKSLPYSSNL